MARPGGTGTVEFWPMSISWMGLFSIQRSSNRDMDLHTSNTRLNIWRSSGGMRKRQGKVGKGCGGNRSWEISSCNRVFRIIG